jgi:hypothetical protein
MLPLSCVCITHYRILSLYKPPSYLSSHSHFVPQKR